VFPILETKEIAKNVYLQRIQAPRISKKRKAGQFLVLRRNEEGERIPLTIVSSDTVGGSVTIIFQAVGKSTTEFAEMKVGDTYLDVVGPLGLATHIEKFGTVVGIIRAFENMAATGSGGFAVVAAGISEALVATAGGLLVGVLAMLPVTLVVLATPNCGAT